MSKSERRKTQNRSPYLLFIEQWCKHYGLNTAMATYLRHHGYTTGEDLLTLYVDDIRRLPDLDDVQKCLLRGAILQYRQSRQSVDKEFRKKGVIFEKKPQTEVKRRDIHSVWRHHAINIQKMDTVVMSMLSPEQRETIRELRRRLHNKRTAPEGKTLYQRILERRQTVLNLCINNESAESEDNGTTNDRHKSTDGRSKQSVQESVSRNVYKRTASESQLPEMKMANSEIVMMRRGSGRRNSSTIKYHGSSEEFYLERAQKDDEDKPEIETFLTSDDDHNLQHNDTNIRDDDKSKQEIDALLKSDSNHNIPNENEADITSSAECGALTENELNGKLDDLLNVLLVVGLDNPTKEDPDTQEVNLEESRRKTDEVLRRLERELFSEDEKTFIAKLEQLQNKYDDVDNSDYEQELVKLIGSM
ncbi:hypothetical protein LSH36_701g01011 [Paralvinella palmiformis]|uniref:Uncharacterized protein n=1 Tax=Paralvinella palmiformis TaxID=53620 RepID=A0AAD9MTR5_9ANNE|nr:hypothetical protein LSH36_701g01011 [Paralvinella palmiformis]